MQGRVLVTRGLASGLSNPPCFLPGCAVRAKRSQWLSRHALGRVFVTIHDQSVGLAGLLNQLGELALFSKYEWDPFSQPRRLPYEVHAPGT